jgi:hypothetical protein
MDQKTLEFIADNFSFSKLSKKIIRTKIPNNKYAVLRCSTQYDSSDFLEFILSPEIKTQKANITGRKIYCSACDKKIKGEYFGNDYGIKKIYLADRYNSYNIRCKQCFECMRNALVLKKKNITFVYIDEKIRLSPIYVMKDKIIKHIYITIINTTPFYKRKKIGFNMCDYCYKEKTKLHFFTGNKNNYLTICKKCLKFRKYASFMNNYNFVYIKEIFIINNLLPELKKNIAKYMLRVVAY